MKNVFISEEEIYNCNLVKELMAEVFEKSGDKCLVQAEQFGFALLEWFDAENGFDTVKTYREGRELLDDLIEDLQWTYVYEWAKDEEISDSIEDLQLWEVYPKERRKQLDDKIADIRKNYEERRK